MQGERGIKSVTKVLYFTVFFKKRKTTTQQNTRTERVFWCHVLL